MKEEPRTGRRRWVVPPSISRSALLTQSLLTRKMLWMWMVMWCSPEGTSAAVEPTEVMGVLGGSATFKLDYPESYDAVLWFRDGLYVAALRRGPPCTLMPPKALAGQMVTPSEDCSSLTVGDLREEDAGEYTAQFLNLPRLERLGIRIFTLKVYKRLSEADLEVDCKGELHKDWNMTVHLNCSAGKWGDGVDFSWNLLGDRVRISTAELFIGLSPNAQDATCVARNPVGNTSRTLSLQACVAGEQPTTRPSTVADTETTPGLCTCTGNSVFGGFSSTTIGATITAWIVAKVIINLCVFLARRPTCHK